MVAVFCLSPESEGTPSVRLLLHSTWSIFVVQRQTKERQKTVENTQYKHSHVSHTAMEEWLDSNQSLLSLQMFD